MGKAGRWRRWGTGKAEGGVGEVGGVGGVGDNVLSNMEEASGQERGTPRTPSRGSPQRYCLTYARESVILGAGQRTVL